MAQIEKPQNAFELKMEEATADAKFLLDGLKDENPKKNRVEKKIIDREEAQKKADAQQWGDMMQRLSSVDREKHHNLQVFLDATENDPSWKGRTRQDRANAYRKQTGYGEQYNGPLPVYTK